MPVLPDGTIILDDAPNDDLYYGRHKEEWVPVVEEAPNDPGVSFVRQNHEWVQVAISTGLTVTEIVPAIALAGMTANITAHVYGTGFTTTTEVLWDGVALATAFVSANELTITVDPTMGVAPSVDIVTVRDGATIGTGAAGFHFISTSSVIIADDAPPTTIPPASLWWESDTGKLFILFNDGTSIQWVEIGGGASDPYHFVLGLSFDDVTRDVNLTPAGWAPQLIGGVWTAGGRSATEGLDLAISGNGQVSVPLATDLLAGSIVEPPQDGKQYARLFDATAVPPAHPWKWVEVSSSGIYAQDEPPTQPVPPNSLWWDSNAGKLYLWYDDGTTVQWVQVDGGEPSIYHFGKGLSFDDTTRVVDLQPAGPMATLLGGVWVPPRTALQAISLDVTAAATGEIKVETATDLLLGGLTEPTMDGLAYSRQWDNVTDPANPKWIWTPALTAGLQITSIIPDKAIYGPAEPPLTVHAYGSEFTTTCVIKVDGNPTTTGYVSPTELTFVMNPAVPISDQFHIITVHETAAPAHDGLGAEQFDFMKATTEVDYGLGLTLDTAPTPPMVNLQPAGDSPATLGGVYVVDRVRNVEEGLELGLDGRLRAPLATDALAGTLLEPPPDDKGYVRRRSPAGVSNWVPPADTPLPGFGTGLTLDETTPPGLVHLQPAGDSPATLGGVYVIDRERNVSEGLELGPDGRLRAPLASPRLAGTIVEPEDDGKGYVRTTLNGVSAWVPPADTPINIASTTSDKIGVVWIPPGQSLAITPDGALTAVPTTPDQYGVIQDAPYGTGAPDDPVYVRQNAAWVESKATVTDYGTGLSLDTTQDPQIVHLQPAGLTPDLLGGVWVPPRGALNGLEINTQQPGMLVAPTATETLAGVLTEPPVGVGQLWARTNSGGTNAPVGKWEPVSNIGTLTYKGAWKPATNDPNIHAMPNKLNGDFWIVDCVDPLVAETPPLGSTPGLDNVMLDEGDWVIWNETAQLWNHIVRTETVLQFRYGLIESGGIVDVTPATGGNQAGPPELGGVYGTLRSDRNGIVIDPQGHISAPLATDLLAGSIVEPKPDDKQYVRTRTPAGVSSWVETAPVKTAGNVPLDKGVVYVPARNKTSQGLDLNADGGLYAPPATHEHLGTILEPPGTGVQFARFRDPVTGNNSWVPVAGGVIISDTPPPNPLHGMLWWESDSGDLFVYYDDGSSAQWVEAVAGAEPGVVMHVSDLPPDPMVAKPKDLWFDSDAGTLAINYQDVDTTQWVQIGGNSGAAGGITEAPIDGTPYSRQDAAWVAAAAGGGLPDAPNDGVQYTRGAPAAGGVNAWTPSTAATGAFVPLDGSGTMTGSLKLASGMGVSYLNASGAGNQWVEMVSAATFDFLGATAPFVYSINAVTNAITFSGNQTINGINPTVALNKTGATGGFASFSGSRNGLGRWTIDVAADTNDDLIIRRHGDNGAWIDNCFTIARADAGVFMSGAVSYGNEWRMWRTGNNSLYFTSTGTSPKDFFILDKANNRIDCMAPLFVNNTPVVMMNEHQAALERIGMLEALLTKLQARLDKCCPE